MRYGTMARWTRLALVLAATGWAAAAAQVADTAQAAPAPMPADPAAPPGTRYTLVEVAGTALPAQIEKEWRCREDVTSGTLTLAQDGRWLLETVTRETCGSRTEEDWDHDDGLYRTEDQTIQFRDDDGEENQGEARRIGTDIDLDELHTGTLAADGGLTVKLGDGRTTLVFRREGAR